MVPHRTRGMRLQRPAAAAAVPARPCRCARRGRDAGGERELSAQRGGSERPHRHAHGEGARRARSGAWQRPASRTLWAHRERRRGFDTGQQGSGLASPHLRFCAPRAVETDGLPPPPSFLPRRHNGNCRKSRPPPRSTTTMSRRAANDSPDEDEEDEFSEPEDYGRSAPGRGGGDDDDFEFEDSVATRAPGAAEQSPCRTSRSTRRST